jgi:hypothetical protein
MNEQELIDVVDEIVDDLNPPRIESEAERLGVSITELMTRVVKELNARLA